MCVGWHWLSHSNLINPLINELIHELMNSAFLSLPIASFAKGPRARLGHQFVYETFGKSWLANRSLDHTSKPTATVH